MSKFQIHQVQRTLKFNLSQMFTISKQLVYLSGKINKLTNLLELTSAHNHVSAAYNSGRIIISNTVKRKAGIQRQILENYSMKLAEFQMKHHQLLSEY